MINFYSTDQVSSPKLRKAVVRSWLRDVAESHGKFLAELNYQFCSDEEILEANRQFLGHDYYTDIITFDDGLDDRLNGDLLISLDTVASNAECMGVAYAEELHRVIVHGLLHLCGFSDKSPEEEQRMRALEDQALQLLEVRLEGRPYLKS